jgi:dimethylhistidine N-methyltransferase
MESAAEWATPRADDGFAASVIEGLSKRPKTLPCRFFYDARGSELFEQITRQSEYYLTRTEVAILEARADEMVAGCSDDAVLVEFGSGSSRKTEILLDRLPRLSAYVPIDVSRTALANARARLEARFPGLEVRPLVGDFVCGVTFPAEFSHHRKIGFFPGSTIGNFAPAQAVSLLHAMRATLSPGGLLIVGVDMKKDTHTLLSAYNDAQGVTAAFNLNLLHRINRELRGTFDVSAFRHEAIYDPVEGRVEMHLRSTKDQVASVARQHFSFFAGETIRTENSYKYGIEQFRQTARSGGWRPRRVWTDDSNLFSVHELIAAAA